jgi:hypothetical protein
VPDGSGGGGFERSDARVGCERRVVGEPAGGGRPRDTREGAGGEQVDPAQTDQRFEVLSGEGPYPPREFLGLLCRHHDSGKRVGNHYRMRGGNKNLKRVFYQADFASLRYSPESRAFYDRNRAEGKRHTQALIARRNV